MRNKQEMYKAVYDGRRFEEAYPDVKSVVVRYRRRYASAFGVQHDDEPWTMSLKAGTPCTAAIECRNEDCTCGFFDMRSIVFNMIAHRERSATGVMDCRGREAPDHWNRCPCRLEYDVEIEYKVP